MKTNYCLGSIVFCLCLTIQVRADEFERDSRVVAVKEIVPITIINPLEDDVPLPGKPMGKVELGSHGTVGIVRNKIVSVYFDELGTNEGGWVSKGDVVLLSRADEYFSKLVEQKPDNYQYREIRGSVRLDTCDWEGAIQDYAVLVQVRPTADNFLARGAAYAKTYKFEQAINDFSAGIKKDSTRQELYLNRGDAYFQRGNVKAAIGDFQFVIEDDDWAFFGYQARAAAWSATGEFKKAISDWTSALELASDDHTKAYLHNNIGSNWQAQGDFERAIEESDTAIELDGSAVHFYLNRAQAWLGVGKPDKAKSDFLHVLQSNPTDAYGHLYCAEAWRGLRDYEKAMYEYDCAIQLEPKNPSHLIEVAFFCATWRDNKARNGQLALKYAQQACELSGWKNHGALAALAAAYAELGKFDRAVEYQEMTDALWPPGRRVGWLKLYQDGKPLRK